METVVAIIFLVIGGFLFGASASLLYRTRQRHQTWQRARGTIVAHAEFTRDRHTMYRAQIRFAPGNSAPVTFTSNFGSTKPRPAVGEAVDVLYPATAPNQAVVRSFSTLYMPGILLGFLAICLLSVSLSVIYPFFVHK